jgi:hypothetical protein
MAAFYSYATPEPPAFASAPILPEQAFYDPKLGQFLLPYDAVRQASSPDELVLQFLERSYTAAAELGHWDRARLERARPDPFAATGHSLEPDWLSPP